MGMKWTVFKDRNIKIVVGLWHIVHSCHFTVIFSPEINQTSASAELGRFGAVSEWPTDDVVHPFFLLAVAMPLQELQPERAKKQISEWKALFTEGQIPDLSMQFNPKKTSKIHSCPLFLWLHFKVHKRIWQQHICREAVSQRYLFVSVDMPEHRFLILCVIRSVAPVANGRNWNECLWVISFLNCVISSQRMWAAGTSLT